jgi:uncharacterized membrane protein YebE (DUF533 family)
MKAMTMTLAVMVSTGGLVYAQGTETPRIDQRQANQQERIDQGVASGQLTEREAHRLNRQQEHIDKMESKAKADGVVTKRERSRIERAQDRTSRHIVRQKHDAQGKRHR